MMKDNQNLMLEIVALMQKVNYADHLSYEYAEGQKLFPAEIHAIEMIGRNSDCNVTQLATKTGVTKGAISRMAKRLEEKRLIIKKQQPDNKKETYLCLTSEGEKVFDYHMNCHKMINQRMEQQINELSQEERTGVEKFLKMSSELLDVLMKNEE